MAGGLPFADNSHHLYTRFEFAVAELRVDCHSWVSALASKTNTTLEEMEKLHLEETKRHDRNIRELVSANKKLARKLDDTIRYYSAEIQKLQEAIAVEAIAVQNIRNDISLLASAGGIRTVTAKEAEAGLHDNGVDSKEVEGDLEEQQFGIFYGLSPWGSDAMLVREQALDL